MAPAATVSWGRVLRERWGLLGGVAFPGPDVGADGERAAGVWVYSFATVQGARSSFGVGPGVSWTGATLTAGGEVWTLADGHVLALGAFTRLWRPWERGPLDAIHPIMHGVRAPSVEVGLRLRLGRVQFQYAWLRPFEGPVVLPFPVEGAFSADDLHTLSIGLVFARDPAP